MAHLIGLKLLLVGGAKLFGFSQGLVSSAVLHEPLVQGGADRGGLRSPVFGVICVGLHLIYIRIWCDRDLVDHVG